MAAKRIKKNRKNCEALSGPRYWVAMGTLAAYTAVGSGKPAVAQSRNEPVARQTAETTDPTKVLAVRRFDIPAGTLDTVIEAFEKAAGAQVKVRETGILTLASPGVSGLYTVEQALQHFLAGSGVSYRFTGPGVIALHLSTVSTAVEVTAQTEQVTSAKYPAPLLDTPQSVDVVSKRVMQEQGVTTLRDALRNFSGISLAAGEGGAQGDNLTIRGFTARNDLFLDGMRDFASYYRDPFNLEEVEVLQGPSSVTFGRGSTGGVVNQETKTPVLSHFLSAGLQFGTDATRRATLDINTPIPAFGVKAAFRLDVMGDIGGVAERNVAENRRFGIAPSLSFGLGTPTRLTLSYFHENEDDNPDYGLPWYFNGPPPVDRQNYYGLSNGNFLRTYDDIGTLRLDHDFNGSATLHEQIRYDNGVRNVLITEPQIPAGTSLSTPLSAIQINRHEIGVYSDETSLDEQLDLTFRFKTGFIRHTVVTGLEGIRETSDPTRPTYPASSVPTTSLLDPDPTDVLTGGAPITSRVSLTALTAGAYALDTMRLGEKWQLVAGIRYDRMSTDYSQSVAPTAAFSRVDNMPSWRTALSYSPKPNGNIYFAAGDSFNPSAESLSLSAGTANLPPEKNFSYEMGTKWDLASQKLSLRTAVFRTDKVNAREPDPNNPLLNVLAGNQRVDGAEGEITGRLTDRWQVLTGYALLASRLVSSNAYPTAIGFPLANVPRNTANLWSTYNLPWHHVSFGGGLNFVDSRSASSTVPLDPTTGEIKKAPSYWLFNAMVRFPMNEHIDVQINGNNLTNRYYYDELHPAHIVLGEGRTALVGINFKF
jgi:catecholate siderophore receptor